MSPKAKILFVVIGTFLASNAMAKKIRHAHVHGSAKLQIAVSGSDLQFELKAPAESLFGFEHEPKTDAEKAKVESVKTQIDSNAVKFVQVENVTCEKKTATLSAFESTEGATESGTAKKKPSHHHSDATVKVELTCNKPLAGTKIDVQLMKEFPRIKKLKVEVVSDGKQVAKTLSATDTFIGI